MKASVLLGGIAAAAGVLEKGNSKPSPFLHRRHTLDRFAHPTIGRPRSDSESSTSSQTPPQWSPAHPSKIRFNNWRTHARYGGTSRQIKRTVFTNDIRELTFSMLHNNQTRKLWLLFHEDFSNTRNSNNARIKLSFFSKKTPFILFHFYFRPPQQTQTNWKLDKRTQKNSSKNQKTLIVTKKKTNII